MRLLRVILSTFDAVMVTIAVGLVAYGCAIISTSLAFIVTGGILLGLVILAKLFYRRSKQ